MFFYCSRGGEIILISLILEKCLKLKVIKVALRKKAVAAIIASEREILY